MLTDMKQINPNIFKTKIYLWERLDSISNTNDTTSHSPAELAAPVSRTQRLALILLITNTNTLYIIHGHRMLQRADS
jgi:hypothetical protein